MGKNLEESPQSPLQPERNPNLPKLSRRSKIPVRISKNSTRGRKTLLDKKQRSAWENVEYENNLSNFLGSVQRESDELKALRESLLVLVDPILEAPEKFRSKSNRADDGECNKCDFNGFKPEGETEQDRAERDRENATEADTGGTGVASDSQERRENEIKLDEKTMEVPLRVASAGEVFCGIGEWVDAQPEIEVGSPARRCTTPTLFDNKSPHETEAIARLEVNFKRDDVREEEEEMKVTSAVLADMDDERTQVRVPESIVEGVAALCATAPGCSRVSDALACATRPEDTSGESGECATSGEIVQVIARIGELASRDENGLQIDRDQLEKLKNDIELITRTNAYLWSKDINKRTGDNRLKYLEEKLKAAGITDGVEQVVDKLDYDDNQNLVREVFSCEFDVNKLGDYDQGDEGCYLVYDELEEDSVKPRDEMGTDSDRKQHNPDRENLKSLLKKPGRGKDKKNRVVFNENRNEFFDADYIILIREDCEYDDEDDDGVCTCNQHEMVRLTCCEPGCNCNIYEGYDPTPQSPKFAPPLEFVDAVTLSPPEGYKDMELGEQQLYALQQMARKGQMAAVCRECSQTHDPEGEASDEEPFSDQEGGREKTDQSQQTTPTTPPADTELECEERRPRSEPPMVAVATCNERKLPKDMDDERMELRGSPVPTIPPGGGSPINGILKGGRLWKQQSVEITKPVEPQQVSDASITSDDENGSKRSVRFTEADEQRAVCDGAAEKNTPEEQSQPPPHKDISISPEPTEMMLTFKLGHHVLISNNSHKPNSAVRQLFPCAKPSVAKPGEEDKSHQQFLVTSESLRAFEDAKKSKLPHISNSDADDSIRRAIERNTLRRSLIRYEPRTKKNVQKTDNSLVERIKLLTCDVDEPLPEEEQSRASPPGEEARNSPDTNVKNDKSFSPSSSSSSNSSVSSTYKKITDIFAKRDRPDIQAVESKMQQHAPPDLGGPQNEHESIGKIGNSGNENKKQFLAPLTACVGGNMRPDDYYYNSNNAGERISMASSVGTEYSLEDIEEGLRKEEEETKMIAPDVLAGTPSASESGDELAMFVQQDASRIERIKKKYQADDEDDEHDDYGFNRRPSVRGIKPRFGSTTEILQQIQNQMQPPNNTPARNPPPIAWPYYSETNLSGVDNKRNINQPPNYQYAQSYRPTTLMDENVYQNCTLQRCAQGPYRANVNLYTSSPVVRVGGGCNEYYQSLPRMRGNGRPQSPPPQEVSKGYHQTMVYIPYNHIEGAYYDQNYVRVTNQNQINKRFVDPNYQEHYAKARANYNNVLCMDPGRSESPLPGQFSTARATQTPAPSISSCTYYPRYRAPPPPNGTVWGDGVYAQKINRHSFPSGVMRYPNPDNISLTDSESQHSGHLPNGYRESMPNSPTKPRFIERGVPEGAASVSPQDSNATPTSTVTSPTSPQNPQMNPKPLFYAMNV